MSRPVSLWLSRIFISLSLALWIVILFDLLANPVAPGPNPGGNLFRWLSASAGIITVATAAFVMRRVPGNPVGLLLLAWGVGITGWSLRSVYANITLGMVITSIWSLYFFSVAIPALLLMLYYFPNGQVVPHSLKRWMPTITIGMSLSGLFYLMGFSPESNPTNLPNPFAVPALFGTGMVIWVVIFTVSMISGLISLVLRYRSGDERQRLQLRWMLWLLGVMILLSLIPFPTIGQFAGMETFALIGQMFSFLFSQIFPALGIGLAILVNNLWNIDVIIRRTLVYGVLTAMLALVFFGGVTVLQKAFQTVSGQQSAISVVISTLAIAALFNPLRRRVQDFIDRRFYRKKYNAELAMKKFTELARSETDIEALKAEIMAVVQETMQPEKAGLWLREVKK